MNRPVCGHCPACLGRTHLRLGGAVRVAPFTREQLHRHAERFGWDQVAATAAEYGIVVKPPKSETPRKPKRPSVKDQVRELVRRGQDSPETVAETFNTSVSRARRLIAEATT